MFVFRLKTFTILFLITASCFLYSSDEAGNRSDCAKSLSQVKPEKRQQLKLVGVSRVISAMPGAGKSTLMRDLTKRGIKVSDSDSQKFHFLTNDDGDYVDTRGNVVQTRDDRVPNPHFVRDYTQHIQDAMKENDLVFVSAHEQVRDALFESGIQFDLIRHHEDNKQEVVDRIRNRKSNQPNAIIANVVDSQWESWMSTIDKPGPSRIHVLDSGRFLGDLFRYEEDSNSLIAN